MESTSSNMLLEFSIVGLLILVLLAYGGLLISKALENRKEKKLKDK